jgi:hypothetical protein
VFDTREVRVASQGAHSLRQQAEKKKSGDFAFNQIMNALSLKNILLVKLSFSRLSREVIVHRDGWQRGVPLARENTFPPSHIVDPRDGARGL